MHLLWNLLELLLKAEENISPRSQELLLKDHDDKMFDTVCFAVNQPHVH